VRIIWSIAMDIKLGSATLAIARGKLLRIERARGTVIHCVTGTLWVTQHGDSKDYLLGPGQVLRIENDGPALAHAVRSATLRLEPARVSDGDAIEAWWRPFSHPLSRASA